MKKLVSWSVLVFCACAVSAFAQNEVFFDNQSGEPSLVKLVGPTSKDVEVPTGAKVGVSASAGRYTLKARYGTPGQYRYTKGDDFEVKETASTQSVITITLHKVLGGNYDSKPISAGEFGETSPPPPVVSTGASETSNLITFTLTFPYRGKEKLFSLTLDRAKLGRVRKTNEVVLDGAIVDFSLPVDQLANPLVRSTVGGKEITNLVEMRFDPVQKKTTMVARLVTSGRGKGPGNIGIAAAAGLTFPGDLVAALASPGPEPDLGGALVEGSGWGIAENAAIADLQQIGVRCPQYTGLIGENRKGGTAGGTFFVGFVLFETTDSTSTPYFELKESGTNDKWRLTAAHQEAQNTVRPAPKDDLFEELPKTGALLSMFTPPESVENLCTGLGIFKERPSFSNVFLPIWLQKTRGESGVSYNSFLGVISEASNKVYSETKGQTDIQSIQNLLRDSAANGHKARSFLDVTLQKDQARSWRLFLFGVHVSASETTNTIAKEIKRRFSLDPPFELKFWIDNGNAAYVDVVAP